MMIKILLTLLLTLVTSASYANCVGQVIEMTKKDDRILIETSYTLDGVQWGSNDKKSLFVEQLKSKSKAQILQKITNDISSRCDDIIRFAYKQVNGLAPSDENVKNNVDTEHTRLNKFITDIKSIQVTQGSSILAVDSDFDNVNDEQWEIFADGTKTITTP